MNKILYTFIALMAFALSGLAQNIGNEWINYNQPYYRFQVYEDGVYRISYSDLYNSGFPVMSVNPQEIQIWGRGEQVPVYITNESTGIFSNSDYIEFYGKKNDGWLDTTLYDQPGDHLEPRFSLFSDTATYFITYTPTAPHLRLQTVNQTNYGSFTAEPYFIYHSDNIYSDDYYFEGIDNISRAAENDAYFMKGEGYYAGEIKMTNPLRTKTVYTANGYTSGPQALVNINITGASNFSGVGIDHHTRISFESQVFDEYYEGYVIKRFQYPVNVSELNASQTAFTIEVVDDIPGNGSDRILLSSIKVHYPHTPNLNNKGEYVMQIPDGNSGYAYYQFTNMNTGGSAVLYDVEHDKRILTTVSGSNVQVLIPNTGDYKECHLVGANEIRSVSNITSVGTNARFVNYLDLYPNADFFMITHPSLMSSTTFSTAVDYASYRASTGVNVMLASVEDLYYQYSYGIRRHPLALRNFMRDVHQEFSHELKGLLLLGKGVSSDRCRKHPYFYQQNLVPTLGVPGSDNFITAGLVDNLYQPLLPTGRVSALTSEDVDIYLAKLMEHEALYDNPAPEPWQKNVLHFRGGDSPSLVNQLEGYLNNYTSTLSDTLFGAHVETIRKTSSAPIQTNLTDDIIDRIDNGCSMITFFGHSASVGFDISLDVPTEYSNKGKYPVMLALSCYTGNIFAPWTPGYDQNISEKFVLIRDKAMIAYMASVTTGYAQYLNIYAAEFHRQLSYKNYGQPLGYLMKETIRNIQIPNNNSVRETCLELALHGDPLLRIPTFPLPDYAIEAGSVFTTPDPITSEVDSFSLMIDIRNLGKATPDTFYVNVKRMYPDPNIIDDTNIRVHSIFNRDTIEIRYMTDPINGVGSNTFEVRIDPANTVTELDDVSNNSQTLQLLIQAADVLPIYPKEFAIVGDAGLKLKCSSVYPFASAQNYYFELDTTKYFNSPMLEQAIVSGSGIIEWQPAMPMVDNRVYYWRVSLDSAVNHQFNWRASSFQYISSESGWAQAHFYQFEKDDYQFVKYLENERNFQFVADKTLITARAGNGNYMSFFDVGFDINNQIFNDWQMSCFFLNQNALQFALFDTLSAMPMYHSSRVPGAYGNYFCASMASDSTPFFEFPTETYDGVEDTVWFRRIANFIHAIPEGTPVLMMSRNNSYATNYPNYLYQALDSIGVDMRTVPDHAGIVSFGRKGSVGMGHIELEPDVTQIARLKDSLETKWTDGSIRSTRIGPSKKWYSLHWGQHAFNGHETDSVYLRLVGIEADGTESIIMNQIPVDSAVINNLNNQMDARDYPYARLECYMRDDSLRTAAQLDYWQLRFAPAPELAIDPKTHYEFYADTIMEGDSLRLELAYRNISNTNMDSLLVKYWIIDQNRNQQHPFTHRIGEVQNQNYIVDTVRLPTMDLSGECYLWMEANPINDQTGRYDQDEQSHVNNISQIPFFVENDISNPLIDITFDGIRILDGDIVSAEPEVMIAIKDENQFLRLQDTSLFKVYLTGPDEVEKRLHFTSQGVEQLEFIEAQLPENKAQILYHPNYDVDGEYTLRIQAKDASDNASGYDSYEISYKVINKSTITEVLNWPNPFSTQTHFVFTLTGSELPSYMKIQIMTVTGKVVREIDMDELGPLHIGRNITDYAWDGTDEYGDRLANGVYLYRVVTRMGDKEVELNSTEASQYFTKEFGKMYLIR